MRYHHLDERIIIDASAGAKTTGSPTQEKVREFLADHPDYIAISFLRAMLTDLIRKVAANEGCLPQAALRDILTDLRHIAANNRLGFDHALSSSAEVFAEEQAEAEQTA